MESQAIASYQTPSGQKVEIIKQSFFSSRKKPTKRVAFVSGLHGNELEGIYFCHLLTRYLKQLKVEQSNSFQGEVHIYPTANPQAISAGTRLWPFFSNDYNRQFGDKNGNSLPAQSAIELINDLKSSADIVVDFHTSNLHLKESPQIRIIDGFHKKLIPLAVECNVDLIWIHPASPLFETTLGYNLNKSKIPTLVLETGIALRINQGFSNRIFQGMLNLLKRTNVINLPNPLPKINYPIIVQPSQVTLLDSKHAGLFIENIGLKKNVSKGEKIGTIIDMTGGKILQEISAPIDGFLFTIRKYPLVYPGAPLARIADKNIY